MNAMAVTLAASLVSVAGAQTSRITLQASLNPLDHAAWSRALVVQPGQTVYVRLRVSLQGVTVLGFAGCTLQPTLTNWRPSAGDVVAPFTYPGLDMVGQVTTETAYEGRQVRSIPESNTGRYFPFGAPQQGAASNSGLLVAHSDPGGILRFAGSNAVAASTNAAWGVAIGQLPPPLIGSAFDRATDVAVFQYGITLGGSSPRTLVADVAAIAGGVTKWHICSNCLSALNVPASGVDVATITVVPSVGAGGVCAAVFAFVGARSRRP